MIRSRATGTQYTVDTAAAQGLDGHAGKWVTTGKWVTICETHGSILNSDTKTQARRAVVWPEWCRRCRPLLPMPA